MWVNLTAIPNGVFIYRRYGKFSFHLTWAESAQIALWMVNRGMVDRRWRCSCDSRPLGPHLFSTICGQILSVTFGQAFCDIWKVILIFFEVSLSSDSRNHTAKKKDAADTSRIDLFGILMTVHFFTQVPETALRMPSDNRLTHRVRLGAVKLEIVGFCGVQTCAHLVSNPLSQFLTIFLLLFAKFFSLGPKTCLAMPSNST